MKYSCRPRLLQPAAEFELAADGLVYRGPFGVANIPFSDITEIMVFKERRFGSSRSYWACTLRAGGRKFRLSAAHRLSLLRTEDRTASYIPFIKEFERRAVSGKPDLRIINDEYRESLRMRLSGRVTLCALELLGLLPRRVSASLCAAAFRCAGPMLRGHRYAHRQLATAMPALDAPTRRRLVLGMWDNMGRTFGEYPHLSELMEFSPAAPMAGPVIMDDRTADLFRHIARDVRGALMFGAHLGNWEILGMAARAGGREMAALYKRQPSSVLTNEIKKKRAMFAARLIEVNATALREIVGALRDGLLIGMLVDQYYANGIEVVFFGQVCRVNPGLALLARAGNWPIYGGRVVRLPDQRHQLEVVGPLQLPHNSRGEIDVRATMQAVFSIIETWVREHPEQWMWVHRLIR
jgi:Kdo2-lipid IVA lauroyltransferase/acyltransferase